MKSFYKFSPSPHLFLFNETVDTKEVISGINEAKKEGLTKNREKELDKEKFGRLDNALINEALEEIERTGVSLSFSGKIGSEYSEKRDEGIELPEGFEGVSSSSFLKRLPSELYSLFVDTNGVVNFHGNNSAKRNIGAGDLFGPDQKFIKVNGVVGQRSIDSKFHGSKVGYVTEDGNYLPITGGETISTDSTDIDTTVFSPSSLDSSFTYTQADGTILSGELAYQAQFLEEVEITEEYEALDWEEKVQKSDEDALNTKVDLSRLPGGNEQMARTIGRILAHKDEYLYIQSETGVPWMLVAAIHARESSNKFNTYLHNGELLGKPTTLVPKGIFFGANQWKEAAVDAVTRIKTSKNEFSSLNPNSSLGEMALFAEAYNGPGYRNRGITSPYVYSGTDKYTSGKYVADHVFDASAVDQQLGVMPIILALRGYE